MKACVFCEIVSGAAAAHLVHEDAAVVAFLDRRPLFAGHVLVVPREHAETLGDLRGELVEPLFLAVRRLSVAVEAAMGAQGTFVAMNNRVSQSVPHLHVHVVPRRKGDGIKGFFWPRRPYNGEEEMAEVAGRIRNVLSGSTR